MKAINRRTVLKTTALTALGLSIPAITTGNENLTQSSQSDRPTNFPNIDPVVISEVVGKSHFDLNRVKELVDPRPELSKCVWEWRFGDFESAIGAASHVGRRDIALYLIEKGASASLFTFAMLGNYAVVKAAIEAQPGIQKVAGPHGISLLAHANAGQRMKGDMTPSEVDNLNKTIDHLESLGDANGPEYIPVNPEDQEKYLGDYKYGNGDADGFTIQLNMRKLLSLGPIGEFGGALFQIKPNEFIYNGSPSVKISFEIEGNTVKSLSLKEPTFTLQADKV